jgi:hypothetical protein
MSDSSEEKRPDISSDGPEKYEPPKIPLPKPKEEYYGFTFRNLSMLAISGVFASCRAIRDGAKWYGSELRHHPKRTAVRTLVAATAVGLTVALLFNSDSDQDKSAPQADESSATTVTSLDVSEPIFGWSIDDCEGAAVYIVNPGVKTLSEALMDQVPGMDSNEVLPIAEDIASESDVIGDKGNLLPAGPPIYIAGPASCLSD